MDKADAQWAKAEEKLQIWFFRDMLEGNRLALFSLFGLKPAEMDTQAKQRKVFRRILSALTSSPEREEGKVKPVAQSPALYVGGNHLVKSLRDWANWMVSCSNGNVSDEARMLFDAADAIEVQYASAAPITPSADGGQETMSRPFCRTCGYDEPAHDYVHHTLGACQDFKAEGYDDGN